ncbi:MULTISPECIES: CBS domain-containing protein [Maribacter]|uniref:CBS domain-containing protein n=1 Tax=Maribacter flavus TaxID=1658664 RepID=A0ABU7IEC6_9FLAO|nr:MULTISPECIES: CBS domain-containing protein [Maribacter]MDC6404157.1 CBS domain-containing protein [Maribacter sp. PR66]MEE1971300.1 CBS domain-containing protein [Maribacter flavus]
MGIKSYEGPRAEPKPDEVPLRVSDYMTRELITFDPDQAVEEVIEILIKNKISGGPVVNEGNELIGIISEGDCIKYICDSRYYNMPADSNSVSHCMVKNVETIDGNMNIFDAAKKFLEAKRRRFPIIDKGKLVGQISQKDILKATVQLKSQNWK